MTAEKIAPLADDESPRPEHSLPSYSESTPEEPRRITREEEAEQALKNTVFAAGARPFLITAFVVTVLSVPLLQFAIELGARAPGKRLPTFEILRPLPSWKQIRGARNLVDFRRLLPRAEELKAAEKTLETESVVSRWLLPRVQSILSGALQAGTEQVYIGRDGWLFYRPDVSYVTGPPFLSEARMKQRTHGVAAIHPNPVRAIVEFRDQLAARGIDLVIVPVPVKPTIDGEMLAARATPNAAMQNASFAEFQRQMEAAGVRVFDPAPALMARKAAAGGTPLYLKCDTHWHPATMEFAAENLAGYLHPPAAGAGVPLQLIEKPISGVGDVARMLKLPANQTLYRPQPVTIRQVAAGNSLWRPAPTADVLLLGDSFANIFSLEGLGWGEAAGFAEHLSHSLGDRPLDCILRNSDGAFATREILSHELARGRDRLAGKKLVIWEFAARELAIGDWKSLPMKLGHPQAAGFFSVKAGESIEVHGTVEAVSSIPRPGTVPYQDHIMAVHLTDISALSQSGQAQALVYLLSMRENVWTAAARLRPGDSVKVRLRAWSDVSGNYEKINRSELDDAELQLEEPVWGELSE